MSTVMNSQPAPAFITFAPSLNGPARAVARINRRLKSAGANARDGFAAGLDVVLDGDMHGMIEAVALVAAIGSTAVFTLAVFGVPVGLN